MGRGGDRARRRQGNAGRAVGLVVVGDAGAYAAATSVIAGHIAPVFTGFKGGKGVATGSGAILGVFPLYFPVNLLVLATSVALSPFRMGDAIPAVTWVAASILWRIDRLAERLGPRSVGRPHRLLGARRRNDRGQVHPCSARGDPAPT